jgi:hypothetical protein
MERFDAIVLGTGQAGKPLALELGAGPRSSNGRTSAARVWPRPAAADRGSMGISTSMSAQDGASAISGLLDVPMFDLEPATVAC